MHRHEGMRGNKTGEMASQPSYTLAALSVGLLRQGGGMGMPGVPALMLLLTSLRCSYGMPESGSSNSCTSLYPPIGTFNVTICDLSQTASRHDSAHAGTPHSLVSAVPRICAGDGSYIPCATAPGAGRQGMRFVPPSQRLQELRIVLPACDQLGMRGAQRGLEDR